MISRQLNKVTHLLWWIEFSILVLIVIFCFLPASEVPDVDRSVEPIPVEVEIVSAENRVMPFVSIHQLDVPVLEEPEYTDYEVALMARVVHAEAGNQDLTGKRLIADVILNRVDSLMFPNTVEGVVMQNNQFSMWDSYTDEDLAAVKSEIESRMDPDIIFFRINHYHSIGVPAYQHGDHYFSTM